MGTRIISTRLARNSIPPPLHFLPSPPLRGRGVGGEGGIPCRALPPHPRPLSPEAGARGGRNRPAALNHRRLDQSPARNSTSCPGCECCRPRAPIISIESNVSILTKILHGFLQRDSAGFPMVHLSCRLGDTMQTHSGMGRRIQRGACILSLCFVAGASLGQSGCTTGLAEYVHNGFKVGPNYRRPPAPCLLVGWTRGRILESTSATRTWPAGGRFSTTPF